MRVAVALARTAERPGSSQPVLTKPSGHLIVPPERWLLHHHIPRFVEASDQPLCHDVSVQAVGVVLRFTPLKPQRERECVGDRPAWRE